MEKFDLENFPTSYSAQQMLSYVSDGFYDASYVGKWIYQVMGVEYDDALKIAEELPKQFFPETATWGLMYHEIKWGLPLRPNLSYDERRKLIYQKRDCRAPMTPYHMENYLAKMTGFEVHIADVNDPGDYGFVVPHPNVFKVYFLGEGTVDSKLVREMLDRLKQSHTTYSINDRIEIEVDSRNLEEIVLRNIRFQILVSFWDCYVFDGSWRLDGSVILNAQRRYNLVFGLKYQFEIDFWGGRCFDGSWDLDGSQLLDARRRYSMLLGMRNQFGNVQVQETITSRAVFCLTSDFWKGRSLDGEYLSDINEYKAKVDLIFHLGLDFSKQEAIDNVAVETKTSDYWFLDGTVSLDGSRNLNAIYRKEVVE